MNPRVILLVALSAAVAAAVYFFLSPSTPPAATGGAADSRPAAPASGEVQPTGGAGKNSAGGNSPGSDEKKPAMNWERFISESSTEATAEDIARFLAKHGETPANLVTAFEHSHDRRLLEHALELFPNSPIVLMIAVDSIPSSPAPKPGETYQPDAQRMAFIERFKAADPNNPLPWIYSAQELFKAGQTGDAVADIRAALERPAFYTYTNERMDSTQQFLEDGGHSPVEAGLIAMASLPLPHMSAAMQASRSLTEWQKAATESGDTASAADAIQLTYNLGRTFATPEASRTLIGQLVGISMEYGALKALPADAQPDWLAVTPAQRIAEMEAQKQNVKDLTAGFEWVMQSQNEQLLGEYLRRNRNDGELSALTWLKAQRK